MLSSSLRLLAFLAVLQAGGLGLASWMGLSTLSRASQDVTEGVMRLTLDTLARSISAQAALGIQPGRQPELARLIAAEASELPGLRQIQLRNGSGALVLESPPQGEAPLRAQNVTRVISDDLGQPLAELTAIYDGAPHQSRIDAVGQELLWSGLVLWLGLSGAAALFLRRVRAGRALAEGKALRLRIGLLLASLLLIGTLALSALLLGRGAELLAPGQMQKADRLALSLAAKVERALDLGIPATGLQGVDALLEEARIANPDLALIRLELRGLAPAQTGTQPPEAEAAHRPIRAEDPGLGRVVVTPDPAFMARNLAGITIDLAVITLIITLIGLELTGLFPGALREGAEGPAGAGAIRAPLFLFMFAHELSRPFLPAQAMALSGEAGWLSPALAASLPISAFMLVVALLQLPFAARSARWGRGRTFRIGAATGALGFALGALASGPFGLIGAQIIAAIGFALVFVSCQGHILDTCSGPERVAGLATMVGAIMVAGLCGPAVGGMVASSFGAEATFLLMGLIALGALGVGWRAIPLRGTAAPAAPAAAKAPTKAETARRLPGLPLLALMLGCALPAKILLFATCFYLIPLQMTAEGASLLEIGRMQMIYPVITVLMIPGLSQLSRRLDQRLPFVLAGAVLTALALSLPMLSGGDPVGFALLGALLIGFGLAQSLSITPQAALVGEIARAEKGGDENFAYGLYRLIERGGSALGPVIGAMLLPLFGFAASLALLAGLSLVGAALFGASLALHRRNDRSAERALI